MSEWKKYKLGEIAEKIGDGLHGTPKYVDDGEYFFINGSNLIDGKIVINSNTKKVSENEFIKYKKELSDNTILLGINGTIGNIANYKNEKCILGKSAAYINVGKNFDKNFIRYVLANSHFQNFIVTNASGTTIKNVGLGLLREYEFYAPENKIEQTRIAQILTSLDDKIELLGQMNQTLETMAQTIFKEWFVNFNFPGFDGELVDGLQKGWRRGKLGEIFQPKKGRNITKAEAIEGEIPVVAGGLEPSCYHNKSNTNAPVVTVSSSGANAGFVRLYNTPVWSSDSCYIDNTIYPYVYFVYLFLKQNQSIIYNCQQGCAQPHIYPSHIMNLDIAIGNEKIAANFENLVTPPFEKILENQHQIRTLTHLRDTLLPKLMSGVVEVGEFSEDGADLADVGATVSKVSTVLRKTHNTLSIKNNITP